MVTREQKKGFSLIELTVVMSIMAVLSVLGLIALFLTRQITMVDQASNEILSQIREVQNKAISVSSTIEPDGTATIPIVWGVKVNSEEKTVETFYLKADSSGKNVTLKPFETFTYNQLSSLKITSGANTKLADYYAMYSTPFGKYYGTKTSCTIKSLCVWKKNTIIPKDYIIDPTNGIQISGKVEITAESGSYSRAIVVTEKGESYAE
jgi:prepilin-type N-terminal cleavage/methylation domain-containing protein